MHIQNIPKDESASDATNLDIKSLRKTEHDQYRESLDELAAQLSRLSDTHEYLDNLASFAVSKTDFKNSENIQSARSLISNYHASSPSQQTGDLAQPSIAQIIEGDDDENLDNLLDRSVTLSRTLIITLRELRAKRNAIKSYGRELTKLNERRQEIEDQLKVLQRVSDGARGPDSPEITINATGDKANHVNEDGHITTELSIEYRNIDTLDQSIDRVQRDNYTEDFVDNLVESIGKNGWQKPILLLDDKVIDGRARLLAAKKLGETNIPVIDLSSQIIIRHYKVDEIFLLLEELISKQFKQYSMASESERTFAESGGEDASLASNRVRHQDQKLSTLIAETELEIEYPGTGTTYRKISELRKALSEEKWSRPDTQSDVPFQTSPIIAPRNVKAEITIVLDGKPVPLFYKSEILEMLRNTKNELLGKPLDHWKRNPGDFSTNYPLSAIVLNVLDDGVSRTAKELAQDLFNRPRGFQWVEVVEQLRPRLTKILWRHRKRGYLKQIGRGRYARRDSRVEYANQVSDYSEDTNVKDRNGNTPPPEFSSTSEQP